MPKKHVFLQTNHRDKFPDDRDNRPDEQNKFPDDWDENTSEQDVYPGHAFSLTAQWVEHPREWDVSKKHALKLFVGSPKKMNL